MFPEAFVVIVGEAPPKRFVNPLPSPMWLPVMIGVPFAATVTGLVLWALTSPAARNKMSMVRHFILARWAVERECSSHVLVHDLAGEDGESVVSWNGQMCAVCLLIERQDAFGVRVFEEGVSVQQ